MSAKRTTKPSDAPETPLRGRADLSRLRGVSEQEIAETSPPELANLSPDFWDEAVVVSPQPKEAISLRVDQDVLRWFRQRGPRYQSRMNAVLRSYMTAMENREKHTRSTPRRKQNEGSKRGAS